MRGNTFSQLNIQSQMLAEVFSKLLTILYLFAESYHFQKLCKFSVLYSFN